MKRLAPIAFVACFAASIVACGGGVVAAPPPATPAPAPSSEATRDRSGYADHPSGTYQSVRLGVTVQLPDRVAWSIVDTDEDNSGALVATHAATHTTLRLTRTRELSLVGRQECVQRAELLGAMPRGDRDRAHFDTLALEPVKRPGGWDGTRWIATETLPIGGLRGHAVLAMGHDRSCLVLHATTDVASDIDAEPLADRLEILSSRTLGTLRADRLDGPPRPTVTPP